MSDVIKIEVPAGVALQLLRAVLGTGALAERKELTDEILERGEEIAELRAEIQRLEAVLYTFTSQRRGSHGVA